MSAKKKAPAKKGRGNPAGPPVRGIRNHSTVDQQEGFREFLKELLQIRPKLTLNEMLERVKKTNYWISRSSLARFGFEFEIERAKRELITDMAEAYSRDGESILDVETAIANLGQTKILAELLDEEKAQATLDKRAIDLLSLFHRLQTSSSARERAKLAHNRGVKTAAATIREEMMKILKKDPNTLGTVLRAIEQASTGAKR